ncbi:hypothetical protein EGW08_022432, partial [Elysia chlorotica]
HGSSSNSNNIPQQQPPLSGSTYGVREDSPKRVDFSRAHQLREVNWDGTYQDSLTFPPDLANSTLTSSRDIRDTNLNFLNFSAVPGPGGISSSSATSSSAARGSSSNSKSRGGNAGNSNNNARHSGQSGSSSSSSPPFAPPPSVSNSSVNYHGLVLPPATPSSSASSLGEGMTQHRHHVTSSNNTYPDLSPSPSSSATDFNHHHIQHHHQHQRQHPDVRWSSGHNTASVPYASSSSTSSSSLSSAPAARYSSSGKPVTASLSSSATSNSVPPGAAGLPAGRSARLAHVDVKLAHEAKSSSSSRGQQHQLQPALSAASKDLASVRRHVEDKWAMSKHSTERPSVAGGSSTNRGAGLDLRLCDGQEGGGASVLLGGAAASDAGELYSPRRARPIKMAITADLKDDEIMLKLKERLKQQRALASSSSASGSNDTSLVDTSSSMAPPPALPPRQPLTGDSAPPRPRKVAAAHPAPGYRGFSTEPMEQHRTAGGGLGFGRPNTKNSGAVRKKTPGLASKRQPQIQPKRHDTEGAAGPSRQVAPQQEQRPKKVARLIASSGDKKSSKTGAKNIITTSSWRAGQDLILKELGMAPIQAKVKVKTSSPSQGHGEGQENEVGRSPDGAEASETARIVGNLTPSDDPLVNEVVAKSKSLSEDTRHMLQELQLGNNKDGASKEKSPHRPPKRKAPKLSASNPSDPERQQQPSEKSRHYDADSVRRFMAKQKADRLKKQQEEKLASQKANEKRQQMMERLAETQRAKAARSLPHEVVDKKKQRKDAKPTSKSNKENADAGDEFDDDSTLTGDSEEELTPQATPRADRDEAKRRRRTKKQEQMEFEPSGHNATFAVMSAGNSVAQENNNAGGQSGTTTAIEFKGQTLNLDLDNVFSRFSQVVNQRAGLTSSPLARPTETSHLHSNQAAAGSQLSGLQATPPFDLGTSNAVSRTNE